MSKIAYVIGGFGFLGTRLVAHHLAKGWQVGVIDPAAPTSGPVAVGGPGGVVQAVRGVVSADALDALEQALGAPQRVYHLGGSGSVGVAAADPATDRLLTVESTRLLVERCGSARLVLVSSAAVYGEGAAGAIAEGHPLAPISAYGRHKAEAEAVIAGSPSHAVVRLFSLYGPGLRKQLLWDACHKLVRGEGTFGGTGDELRDWLHVDDAVSLLEIAAAASDPALVINGGTGVGTRVADILEQLRAALGSASVLRFSGAARAGDPRSLVADATRARRLGWRAEVIVQRGVAEYARWFEAQAC